MQERQRGGYFSRESEYYRVAPVPIVPAEQTSPVKPRLLQNTKKIPQKLLILAFLLVVTAVAGGLLIITKQTSPLPASITKQISFAPYLPNDSQSAVIDQASYSWQDGVLTYKVTTADKSQVFVSEQVVPKSFDLTSFLQHIKNKQTLTNKYGQGQAGVSENTLVISEVIGDTWVFMSGPITMNPTQLSQVFTSLQKY